MMLDSEKSAGTASPGAVAAAKVIKTPQTVLLEDAYAHCKLLSRDKHHDLLQECLRDEIWNGEVHHLKSVASVATRVLHEKIRYVENARGKRGQWYVWNGFFWKKNQQLLAQGVVAEFMHDYAILTSARTRRLETLLSLRATEETLRLMRKDGRICTTPRDWDIKQNFVAYTDGSVYVVEDGEVSDSPRKASPSDMITTVFKEAPTTTADCPRWLDFMEFAFPNEETRRWVQACLGSSLVPGNENHLIVVFIGKTNNGKSAMLGAIREALGRDLVFPLSPWDLSYMDPMLARAIEKARLVVIPVGDRISTATIKRANCNVLMACNAPPKFTRSDKDVERRLICVPMRKVITDEMRDRYFKKHLKEKELGGISAWLLEGLRAWLSRDSLMDTLSADIDEETRRVHRHLNPSPSG
ncbi:MAG: hypothetical protein MPJ79_03280 [Alphaproteobacteria bacterium]|nr:hypothetical protein [Alphaproteobacteria bacterium]